MSTIYHAFTAAATAKCGPDRPLPTSHCTYPVCPTGVQFARTENGWNPAYVVTRSVAGARGWIAPYVLRWIRRANPEHIAQGAGVPGSRPAPLTYRPYSDEKGGTR